MKLTMDTRMIKLLYVIIGLAFSSCIIGQANIENKGIENYKGGLDKGQLDLVFQNVKSYPEGTELSIGLIEKGDVRYIGIRRASDTIEVIENSQHAFEIGSVTKVFTATLLSNFVVEEKLDLDDDFRDHLDFELGIKEKITFETLANHTSGLPRMPPNLNLFLVDPNNPYKSYGRKDLIEYLTSEAKLNEEPGSKYEYSNLGAGILGFVLAEISNMSYEDLLQQKIFRKFEMNNSTCKRDSVRAEWVMGLTPDGRKTSNWDFDVLAGGGAIISTVEDLSKFALAQFNDDNRELTLTQQSTYTVDENMSMGLGWHISKRQNGHEWIWHNGGTGGYTSSMALDVKGSNGIIILSNVSAFNEKARNIDKLCFGLMDTLD